jgi:hypothetical protein
MRTVRLAKRPGKGKNIGIGGRSVCSRFSL